MMRRWGLTLAGLLLSARAVAAPPLAAAEAAYADWLDATYAVSTLEAGPQKQVSGRAIAAWRTEQSARAASLAALLPGIDRAALGAEDQRAVTVMERTLADAPLAPAAAAPGESAARCGSAGDARLTMTALSPALYACFETFGNHIDFEGRRLVRTTALELLQELAEPARRQSLFAALAPLFQSINGDGAPSSPYRRLVRQAAAAAGSNPIADAVRTVGSTPDAVESMLLAVLDAWRAANPGPALEPWDYWHHYAAGVHALDQRTPAREIGALSARYYHDLGADLTQLGVLHDLAVRPGKAPLAYSDFVRIGRVVDGSWRPAIARVSANVEHGGLFVLNEIVHEDGHAVHMEAVRTRPAFFALGDDLFVEAFADVTSWSVAEPQWQRRYLGTSVAAGTALRALFANVMLDVAWGLFELRLLRAPDSDPNAVWTQITARYLNVVPHPQLSWWALRVQLVDKPGYMINYGLGAIVTAELRARLRERAGDFTAGNPGWYGCASRELLRYGAAIDTPELLRLFLGHAVSVQPLLKELGRIAAHDPSGGAASPAVRGAHAACR